MFTQLIATVLLLSATVVTGFTLSDETNLVTALEGASNVDVRPAGSVEVYTHMGITQIISMVRVIMVIIRL